MRCSVVAGFLLTSASRSPSAIAELLVNFGCAIHISGMAEARALKFFLQREVILIRQHIARESVL